MNIFIRGLLITSIMVCYPASGADNGGPLSEFNPTLTDEFKHSLSTADVAAGEIVFMRKCSSCHDHEKTGGESGFHRPAKIENDGSHQKSAGWKPAFQELDQQGSVTGNHENNGFFSNLINTGGSGMC